MHTFFSLKLSAITLSEVPDVGFGLYFQLLILSITKSLLG